MTIYLVLLSAFSIPGMLAQSEKPQQTPTPAVSSKSELPIVTTQSYVERARKSGAVLELSLKDAIKMALTNNLEIAIQDFNENINEKRYIGIKGFYDPKLSLEGGWVKSTNPTGSVLTAGLGQSTFSRKNFFWDTSILQNLPWGAAYSVVWNSSRTRTNSQFSTINPQYNSNFTLNFTQPLLRGFERTQTRRLLELTNLDTQLNQSQFEQKVADVVKQVHDVYWELVYAIRNHDIQRQSMELARIQYENNRKRVEIGTLAPIEITIARAEVATREQTMIASEEGISNSQNSLKRLLAEDPKSSVWNVTLLPTDEPTFINYKVNLDESIQKAIQNRPEIDQMKLQIKRNDVDEKFYRQEGKWKVDLIASYGTTGLSGAAFRDRRIDTNGDGVPDTVVGREPDPNSPFFGALGPLYGQIFGNDYRTYTTSVRVEIPLRNRENEMQLAQLYLQEKQLVSSVKNVEQLIMVDVRNAAESIETNRKRVETATLARELSEEQLEGETKRFQAGLSTNFVVLQYQRDLAEGQLRELRALIDYRKAITALEKATYTILSSNDVIAAKQANANKVEGPAEKKPSGTSAPPDKKNNR
ncbi:MAG TPA: TolC family protein [Acidobacteriota bacterium]|jgi:HAE1 family hydrophobic/amphiphilic exporter-1